MQIINAIPIAMSMCVNPNCLCKICRLLVLKLFYSSYPPQYGVYSTASILASSLFAAWR